MTTPRDNKCSRCRNPYTRMTEPVYRENTIQLCTPCARAFDDIPPAGLAQKIEFLEGCPRPAEHPPSPPPGHEYAAIRFMTVLLLEKGITDEQRADKALEAADTLYRRAAGRWG